MPARPAPSPKSNDYLQPDRGLRLRMVKWCRSGNATNKAVLWTIDDYIGRDGVGCWASIKSIAAASDASRSTAQRALKSLEQAHRFIDIEARTDKGQRITSIITINWPMLAANIHPDAPPKVHAAVLEWQCQNDLSPYQSDTPQVQDDPARGARSKRVGAPDRGPIRPATAPTETPRTAPPALPAGSAMPTRPFEPTTIERAGAWLAALRPPRRELVMEWIGKVSPTGARMDHQSRLTAAVLSEALCNHAITPRELIELLEHPAAPERERQPSSGGGSDTHGRPAAARVQG